MTFPIILIQINKRSTYERLMKWHLSLHLQNLEEHTAISMSAKERRFRMSFTIDPLTACSKHKKVASSKNFFVLNFWRDEYDTIIVTHIIGSIGPTTPPPKNHGGSCCILKYDPFLSNSTSRIQQACIMPNNQLPTLGTILIHCTRKL
jgi:hypothetical protein